MARFLLTVVCVVLLGACDGGGGGNGGATCQSFSPCGGSIDGTWQVQDICIEDALSLAGMATDEPACRDLFRGVQTGGSGTMTFQGGTVTSNALLTIEMNAVWTVPCLMAASGVQSLDLPTTCTTIGQNYAMNPDFSASACKLAGQTCDCTVELQQDFALPTRYTLDGSEITFEGDSSVTTYCVSGNTLSISNMDTETSGTLTLTR